jgi:hypothetical protein
MASTKSTTGRCRSKRPHKEKPPVDIPGVLYRCVGHDSDSFRGAQKNPKCYGKADNLQLLPGTIVISTVVHITQKGRNHNDKPGIIVVLIQAPEQIC